MNTPVPADSAHMGTPVLAGPAADVWTLRGLSGDARGLQLRSAQVGALFLADESQRALAALEGWLDDTGAFLRALLEVAGSPDKEIHRPLTAYARGLLALLEGLEQALCAGQTTPAGMTLALPVARKLASFPTVLGEALSIRDPEEARARDLPLARLTITPPARV